MGATEDWLATLKGGNASRMGAALSYDKASPDDVAQSEQIGRELGVPGLAVSASPDVFKRELTQKRAAELLKDAPKTAAWLSQGRNGSLAKDDLDNLTWFERLTAQGQRVAHGASGMFQSSLRARAIKERGLVAGVERSAPDRIQEAERQAARFREILERGVGDDGQSSMSDAERALYTDRLAASELAVRQWQDVQDFGPAFVGGREGQFNALAGALKSWTEATVGEQPESDSLWHDLAYGLGSMLAFVAPSVLPGGMAVTAQMGSDAARVQAYDTALENGADEETAQLAGNIAGFFGVSEAIPIAAMFNRIPKAARAGIVGAIGRVLLDMGKSAAEEGAQEFGMGVVQNVIERLTSDPSQPIVDEDTVREGAVGAILGPLFAGPISSAREVRQIMRDGALADAAGLAGERLTEIDEVVAASKLKQRAPDAFADALAAQNIGEVYVPAADLREFFQAKDVNWGMDEDLLAEQALSGQYAAIPLSTYASKISGTDAAEWVKENAVFSAGDMSAADAIAFNDQVQDILQQAREDVEASEAADRELRAADQQIYDDVFHQLRAAGRSPDVAKHEALVHSAFWRTMQERFGEDALDLARSMGLRIRGPQTEEVARRRNDLDIKLNTLRRGDTKPRGESLLEFVVNSGGVRDTGGDLEALEPPKGVIAETATQERERRSQPNLGGLPSEGKGIGIDEMARRAAEAGYFPGAQDLDANALIDALSEEIAGRPTYRPGEGVDADLEALQAELDRQGIDLALSNDEIAAALSSQDSTTPESFIGRRFHIRVGSYQGGAVVTGFNGGSVVFDLDGGRSGEIPLSDLNGGMVEFLDGDPYPFSRLSISETVATLPLSEVSQKLIMIAREDGKVSQSALPDPLRKEIEAAGYEADETGEYVGAANDLIAEADRRLDAGEWDGSLTIYSPVDVAAVEAKIASLRVEEIVASPGGQEYNQGVLNTETEAFRAWFGDSKVVDENGAPLVVYHGTASDFESFSSAADAKHIKLPGFYFTPDADSAERFSASASRKEIRDKDGYIEGFEGANIVPAYLSIQNPVEIDASRDGGGMAGISEIEAELKAGIEAGHDGAIIRGWRDGSGDVQYVAFSPTQIKSVHNRGTFDPADPRILYQVDAEFATLQAAKAEADRLLDGLRDGGDAAEAFAAFGKVGDARDALGMALAAEPGGVELTNGNGVFAAVTKSQAGGDGWRVTYFNESGFLGHTEHKEKLPAIMQALDDGYTSEAEGALRAAIKKRSFFQEYEQGTKRGSIIFPSGGVKSGETVINLFEQADLSSFLHESGHYFLEAFTALASDPAAPQGMKDDLDAILTFLNAEKSADGTLSAFTTEQHETWARASEAYFMEGKAPSLALADAFSRFKAWLTRIYRSIAGLNVKVTPEIRSVMDRLLATDEEIAEARAEAAMSPLFKDAPAGMAKSDFQAYQRMARRSSEKAEQTLLEKTMAKVRREKEAWFKAEKKAVTKEVEARLNKLPVYRLTELLANGRWIGSDEPFPDMRMDRDALIDMFGAGVLEEISRSKLGGKRAIYKKGGDDPQSVADFFGFPTAGAMVEALQNAGKRQDAIKAEVDRIMDERHGDPFTDGSIEAEALEAIHNEQQGQTVAAETRHLASRLGRSTHGLNTRVFRQRAKAMLGRMSAKDAAKPHNFLAAERRAAKAAERAFAKVVKGGGEGPIAEAYQAKEQQLLSHMLYLEAREFERTLERGRERMRGYGKKSVRAKLEGGYIEQIDALLDRFDFRRRTEKQVANAESLKDYMDRMIADGREAELAIDQRFMDEARRTHYTRLTVDEVRGLFDTIANIDHMGRRRQKLIDAKRKRDLAESVSHVVGAVMSSQKLSAERRTSTAFKALNLIRRPDTILISLDGGKEMGAAYDELKRGVDEGQAEEHKRQVEMAEQFDALFSGHYSRKELRAMVDPKAIPGVSDREWSKQEIIALALNMGAAENHQRVMDRGVDPDMQMNPEKLHNLLSTLTENDWRFVQGMWDMVNSYWPDLAAVHKRRTGVEPEKVQPQLMYDGAPEFVRGGYYPIKYDPTRGKLAAKDEATAWDKYLTAGHGSTAAVRNGMTKQRQATGGGRTIKYDLTVPFQHLRETVRYIALSEAVDNAYRVLNHSDTVEAFQATGNKDTLDTLNLWLKDTAQGPIYNTDPLNSVARMVKNNFTLSRLAFNLKTVLLQATGLGQSAATIGKKNMLHGMASYLKRPNELIAEVTQKSPFMAERQTSFQKDIYDFANDVKIQSPLAGRWARAKKNVAQAGFWPMIKMQFLVVDMPTWVGAYRAGLEKYKGDDAKAVHYADRMVARAQDSGMFGDRAGVERGTTSENVRQADFIRLFTTLGGYMLTKLNRAQVTAIQAKAGIANADTVAGKAAVATSAATDMVLLMAFEPLLMALAYSAMTDEEDEEDIAKFLAAEMGMSVVGGVPIIRDMASAFRGYGGGGIYGSVLEMPYRFGVQAMQGENDKALRRSIGDIIGTATGLPSTATLRLYEGILGDSDTSPAEALFGSNPLER